MKTPTTQPGTDLAELRAKVLELTKTVQTKKEELRKKADEKKVSAEAVARKAEEEQQLKDSFTDGVKFAEWRIQDPCGIGIYTFKIPQLGKQHCGSIAGYIDVLKTAFKKLRDQFEERKMRTVPRDYSRDKAFPASGTVINGCCGGVNEHNNHCADQYGHEVPLDKKELQKLEEEIKFQAAVLHAHMEGFIETILKSKPDADAILDAVKVAMIAGIDTFCEFGGRQKIINRLRTVVVGEIEDKLLNDANLDETGIEEIERILKEIREAIVEQVK